MRIADREKLTKHVIVKHWESLFKSKRLVDAVRRALHRADSPGGRRWLGRGRRQARLGLSISGSLRGILQCRVRRKSKCWRPLGRERRANRLWCVDEAARHLARKWCRHGGHCDWLMQDDGLDALEGSPPREEDRLVFVTETSESGIPADLRLEE